MVVSTGIPATLNPVAVGGCACTTAWASGRAAYAARCNEISLKGRHRPWSFFPWRSRISRSDSLTSPFEKLVGVARYRRPGSLQLRFQVLIDLTIMVNTSILALDKYPTNKSTEKYLEYVNLVFFAIFFLEMLLKMYSYGIKGYFKNKFN